ncbi:MAG: 2'-5' RNA ligase [Bacillota bacterium]
MIKPASLEDELFVVFTLGGKVFRLAKRIQKMIAEHYDLYDNEEYPVLHLTIDRIKKDKFQKAVEVLDEVVNELEDINIYIEEIDCFKEEIDSPKDENGNKLLLLDVKNTISLQKSAKKIHDSLAEKNISTIDNYEQWNFHITLVNNNFASNPISEKDFSELCYLFEDLKVPFNSFASTLEIWKASLDPDKRILKKYNIRHREEDNEE